MNQHMHNITAHLKAIDDRITAMGASADKTALRASFDALHLEMTTGLNWTLRRGAAGTGYELGPLS